MDSISRHFPLISCFVKACLLGLAQGGQALGNLNTFIEINPVQHHIPCLDLRSPLRCETADWTAAFSCQDFLNEISKPGNAISLPAQLSCDSSTSNSTDLFDERHTDQGEGPTRIFERVAKEIRIHWFATVRYHGAARRKDTDGIRPQTGLYPETLPTHKY